MKHPLSYQTIIHQYLTEVYLNAGASASFTFTNMTLENIEDNVIPFNHPEHGTEPSDWSEFYRLEDMGLLSIRFNNVVDIMGKLIDLAKQSLDGEDLREKIDEMIESDTSTTTGKVAMYLEEKFDDIDKELLSVESEGVVKVDVCKLKELPRKNLILELIEMSIPEYSFFDVGIKHVPDIHVIVSFNVFNHKLRNLVRGYNLASKTEFGDIFDINGSDKNTIIIGGK